jgi:hypothetical protein
MGRNKTPTAILDAKGAFIVNPQRARPDEPKSKKPLGKAPKYLSDDLRALWKDIAKRLAPGVATESDRDAFELLVRLTYDMRHDILMKAADRGTLISLWSRFAMTPADRSRVTVEKPKDSALDAFLRRHSPLV